LDANKITEDVDANTLEALYDSGVQHLSFVDFTELQDTGVFRDDVQYTHGMLIAGNGRKIELDLANAECKELLSRFCLGTRLRNGAVLDSGFFFGPRAFYAALRKLPVMERRQLTMRSISFINELYGPESELKAAQRRHARFINTTMMVTGLGAAVSDGLADGRVVSGVGGQYNFVAMAHALPEARSVLCLRSTRMSEGKLCSNIVWNYAHTTIARHLRDIVVSEYGIADLRGKTDGEVVAALIEITDARFQETLIESARRAGKLPRNFRASLRARTNLPRRLEDEFKRYRQQGLFSATPFGSDFTDEELVLGKALKRLKAQTETWPDRLSLIARALSGGQPDSALTPYLARLELDRPQSWSRKLERRLVAQALREVMDEKD
jgi:hypothetical protein